MISFTSAPACVSKLGRHKALPINYCFWWESRLRSSNFWQGDVKSLKWSNLFDVTCERLFFLHLFLSFWELCHKKGNQEDTGDIFCAKTCTEHLSHGNSFSLWHGMTYLFACVTSPIRWIQIVFLWVTEDNRYLCWILFWDAEERPRDIEFATKTKAYFPDLFWHEMPLQENVSCCASTECPRFGIEAGMCHSLWTLFWRASGQGSFSLSMKFVCPPLVEFFS